jgi:hypothetical protein
MGEYQPKTAEEHFALQRTTRAAEVVKAVYEAQQKGNEESRGRDERFYNSLALLSSATVALSVTFLGYLKNLPTPNIRHPHWLIACWICFLTCVVSSLFWMMVYSRYIHYFHEWQTADSLKQQYEVEAEEYPTVARNTISLETGRMTSQQEMDGIVANRREAAAICENRAKGAKRLEKRYMLSWRWLGRIAQAGFFSGFVFLIAFAAKNI